MALVAILGMHRSGTSAVAGMLAEQGVEFGPVRMRNRFNRRGNRELPALNRLHEELREVGATQAAWAVRPLDFVAGVGAGIIGPLGWSEVATA